MKVTGHLRERITKKGNAFELTIELPKDTTTGKRHRKTKTIYCTKRQAQKELDNWIYELEHGTYIEPTKSTVNTFLAEWINTYVTPVKSKTTSQGYQKIIDRYIKNTIGNITLEDLNAITVQKWVNSLSDGSPITNEPLSPQTVKNSFLVLHSAMRKAVELKLIQESPCEYTQLPKLVKYQAKVFDEQDLKKFLKAIKGTDLETPMMIVVSCGLRRGELLALKWSSIDWNDKTLNITENRVQTPCNEIYTKDPKSKAGTRSIVMPNSLFDYLKSEYDRLKLCDKSFSETNYIVHMKDTKEPYRPDVFSQKFKRFLEKNHLKKIRLHDLRHTCATMMLTAGITPKVAQQILGHSEISTTLDTYSHVLKRVEIDAAEKLDKQIFGE